MENILDNKVSLFIPVYNAEKFLAKDIRVSYNALLRLKDDFEIIIVDDNSSDRSLRFKRLIERAKKNTGKDLQYIVYHNGPSRRENLAKSFYRAKYDIFCFIDADFSCDISFLIKALDLLKSERADIVIGSRYIRGAKIKRNPIRGILSFFYNTAINIMFKSTIKDHQCGLKVFRKDTVRPILDEMGYDEKYIRGWFWDAELLIRAQRAKLKIIEMPVEWYESSISTFNIRRELRCLKSIIKLKKELK